MPDQSPIPPAASPDAIEIVRQINQSGTEIPVPDSDLLGKPLVIESYVTGLKMAGDLIEATIDNAPSGTSDGMRTSFALGMLTGHCAAAMERIPELRALGEITDLIDRIKAGFVPADPSSMSASANASPTNGNQPEEDPLRTFVEHDPVSGMYRGRVAARDSDESFLAKGFLVQVTNMLTNETQTVQFDPEDLNAIMHEMERVSTYLDTLIRGDILLTEDDQILELHARRRSMQEAIQKFQISTQAMQALLMIVREISGELAETKQSHGRFMRLGQVLLQRTGGIALFHKKEIALLQKDMTGMEVPLTGDFVLFQPSRYTEEQAFAWAKAELLKGQTQ